MTLMNAKLPSSIIAIVMAVAISSSPAAPGATTPAATNRIASWLDGKSLPHLQTAQAEAYVLQHQRRPEAFEQIQRLRDRSH